jgi:hypothetical protein
VVDRHVDDDAPLLHLADELLGDEPRRSGARDEHGADDEVCSSDDLLDVGRVGVEGLDRAPEDVFQVSHRLRAHVEHGRLGPHPHGDRGRVPPDDAAAQDDDSTAPRPRHSS